MPPDAEEWLDVLRRECAASTQTTVAKRLGVSAAMVNQALGGKYKGDISRLQRLVEGAFMNVFCPVLGEIPLDTCAHHQKQPFVPVNPQRVRLFRACRSGCPHSRIEGVKR